MDTVVTPTNEIDIIINTPSSSQEYHKDASTIRSKANMRGVPCITTLAGVNATVNGMDSITRGNVTVKPLQEYYEDKKS